MVIRPQSMRAPATTIVELRRWARQILTTKDPNMTQSHIEQLAPHVAVSLYQFNVSPATRCSKLGVPVDATWVARLDSPNWATQLDAVQALAYLRHAMERYGREAEMRLAWGFGALFSEMRR